MLIMHYAKVYFLSSVLVLWPVSLLCFVYLSEPQIIVLLTDRKLFLFSLHPFMEPSCTQGQKAACVRRTASFLAFSSYHRKKNITLGRLEVLQSLF